MKKCILDIIYSELFTTWPILKSCYEYYNVYLNQHKNIELPKLFYEYRYLDMNEEIKIYPIGLYQIPDNLKLVYIAINSAQEYMIDEMSLNWALSHIICTNFQLEEKQLDSKNLHNIYLHNFIANNAIKFFNS